MFYTDYDGTTRWAQDEGDDNIMDLWMHSDPRPFSWMSDYDLFLEVQPANWIPKLHRLECGGLQFLDELEQTSGKIYVQFPDPRMFDPS